MHSPKIYAIMLAAVIISHRLPGVVSPPFFKKFVQWYTAGKLITVGGGVILSLLSLWGIYVTITNYPRYGWLIIGLSIVLLHKAMKFVIAPNKAAANERDAWDQSNRNVFLICLGSVIGGGLFLLLVVFAH